MIQTVALDLVFSTQDQSLLAIPIGCGQRYCQVLTTDPWPSGSAVSPVCIAVIYSLAMNVPDVTCYPTTSVLVIWFVAFLWDWIPLTHVYRSDHSR